MFHTEKLRLTEVKVLIVKVIILLLIILFSWIKLLKWFTKRNCHFLKSLTAVKFFRMPDIIRYITYLARFYLFRIFLTWADVRSFSFEGNCHFLTAVKMFNQMLFAILFAIIGQLLHVWQLSKSKTIPQNVL